MRNRGQPLRREETPASPAPEGWQEGRALAGAGRTFDKSFVDLFQAHSQRLCRSLARLSSDPDLAADLVQEAFIRLYRRGSLPDEPKAWLITVAMNLLRNVRSTQNRRRRLLTLIRGKSEPSYPQASESALAREELRRRVRAAMDGLPERDRSLLLLRAEGYSYRDMALALQLNEASVGTLLARARRGFLAAYEDASHASG